MERRDRHRRLTASLTFVALATLATFGSASPASGEVTPTPSLEASPTADPPTPDPGTLVDSTRTTNIYVGGGGTLEAVQYPWSINYQDASGDFQPIDNTLVPVPGSDPDVQNEANSYDVQFPPALSDSVHISEGDRWMDMRLEGANATRVVAGDTVTYPSALPGVTASYTPENDMVKEDLVLAGPDSERTFTYLLENSPDLRPAENGSGGIAFLTDSGQTEILLPPPFMTDASGVSNDEAVSMSLSQTSAGAEINVSADRSWLDAPERQWPVTIDPSPIIRPLRDCHLASGDGPSSNCGKLWLKVGVGGGSIRRILAKFDQGAAGIPSNAVYQSATFGLYLDATQTTTGTAANYSVYRVTQGWTDTASWLYHDGGPPALAWSAQGGDFASSPVWDTQSLTGSTTGWKTWNVTGLAQGWRDGTYTNNGLMVKQAGEQTTNLISFVAVEDGSKCSDPGSTNPTLCQWPYLKVVYNTPPDTPSNVSTGNFGTDTPTLHATFSDRDGGTGYVQYTVSDSSGSAVLVANGPTVASGQDSPYTIPTGSTFDEGDSSWTYTWTARSYDGTNYSVASTSAQALTDTSTDFSGPDPNPGISAADPVYSASNTNDPIGQAGCHWNVHRPVFIPWELAGSGWLGNCWGGIQKIEGRLNIQRHRWWGWQTIEWGNLVGPVTPGSITPSVSTSCRVGTWKYRSAMPHSLKYQGTWYDFQAFSESTGSITC